MKLIHKKYLTTIAIWTGCFILLLFAYMLVLVPQNKSKKQIETQLAEKKRIYNSALEAAQEETKLKLNEEIEQLQNNLKAFVIGPEDLANLIFDIGQVANEKKVDSFSIRTKDTRGRPGLEIPDCKYIYENQIDIGFTAGFNQFATFLNALERHRPVVFVDKFSINRSEQDKLDHQVNMNLAVFVSKKQDS